MVHSVYYSDHSDVLRRVYTDVSQKLYAQSVARSMFQCNALTTKELESIQSKHRKPIKAAERLLNIVINQSGNVYGVFMNAMKHTQRDVYEIIVIDSSKGKPFIMSYIVVLLRTTAMTF